MEPRAYTLPFGDGQRDSTSANSLSLPLSSPVAAAIVNHAIMNAIDPQHVRDRRRVGFKLKRTRAQHHGFWMIAIVVKPQQKVVLIFKVISHAEVPSHTMGSRKQMRGEPHQMQKASMLYAQKPHQVAPIGAENGCVGGNSSRCKTRMRRVPV